jgi:hypothetical protein
LIHHRQPPACSTDLLANVAMTYVLKIKNTFYTVELCDDPPLRSKSAPPRLGGSAPSASKPRGARHAAARRRKRERQHEENTEQLILAEFAAAARFERWALLATRVLAAAPRGKLASGRALPRTTQDKPHLRLQLSRTLFAELAAVCFEREADMLFLVRLGVIRFGAAGMVEIWCSDATLEHPVMQSLRRTGEAVVLMGQDGVFQICVDGTRRPLTLRFSPTLTVADLKLVLLVQGFAEDTYQLVHRRRQLEAGLLTDYGIGAGAFIRLLGQNVVRI